jgi:8-oxo-dGTP diphosphatase
LIRFCSDCGTRTELREVAHRQLDVCPSCGRIFFRNPKVVVTALIEDEGRVLLVLRDIEPGRGLWGLPGGYVDWDEHPEQAMIRECEEETGVDVVSDGLIEIQHVINEEGEGIVILHYRARIVAGQPTEGDAEVREVKWFAPQSLPPLAFATHRKVLRAWAKEVAGRVA